MGIIETIIGNVVAAIIIAALGIGSITIISVSKSKNPRKKWRILMVFSGFALVISGSLTTTYTGGVAHTSDLGNILLLIFGFLFTIGFFGNWIDK